MLTACGASTRLLQVDPIKPSPALTEKCPELSQYPLNANMGDLIKISAEHINMYNTCSARHEALAEWANQ